MSIPVEGGNARQRILAAARRAFFAQGFRRVTMDEMAAQLGMSKKTLYAHFPTKSALIEAVVSDKLARVERDLADVDARCRGNASDRLAGLLACVMWHLGEIQAAFLRDVERHAPELFAQVERRRSELLRRHFGRVLAEGRRQGTVRRDVSAALVVDGLLAAVQAIVNPAKLAELDLAPNKAMKGLLSVFLEGLLTPAGRKRR